MLQGLWFTIPSKRLTLVFLNNFVDSVKYFFVGFFLPVQIVFPGILGKISQFQEFSFSCPRPASSSANRTRAIAAILRLNAKR